LVFEKHFHAEIESIRETLKPNLENDDQRKRSLRLALLTAGQSEGVNLREDVLRRVVLECLSKEIPHSAADIAQTFSSNFGLPRRIQVATIDRVARELDQEGLVQRSKGGWQLTAAGDQMISSFPPEAADAILTGREVIRNGIDTLIGRKLSNDQHERIWSTLLDFLSSLFYQSGLDVIRTLEGILTKERDEIDITSLQDMLRDGARRVSTASASFADDRVLIQTAVLDLLTEREGPAFDWLTATCERFVVLCCLGIESNSATEIRRALTEGGVIPDTDILLTLLCPHADDYRSVRDLLLRWIQLGGKILLAPVVLEEVSYHAWISIADFRETRQLLGKLEGADRYRYLRNAFVREFHALNAPEHQWDIFIGQYRGNSSGDYARVQKLLTEKLFADVVPDKYDTDLAKEITNYMMEQVQSEEDLESEDMIDEDTQYKLERDGRLLASIAAFMVHGSASDSVSSVTILSSSSLLRHAASKYGDKFLGNYHVTLPRASFAYLLSMIPDAQLGVDSLRRALFDYGSARKLHGVEQRALRIIKSSGVYDIPWAERPLLATQLKKSMKEEASRLGITPKQISESVQSGTQPETSARVIIDAVAKLAKDPSETKKLREAERKIVELEIKLGAAQELLRKGKISSSNGPQRPLP
jgi:hypothetical protein